MPEDKWSSGYAGEKYATDKVKKKQSTAAAGDAPVDKKGKGKEEKGKEDKGKVKEEPKEKKGKEGKGDKAKEEKHEKGKDDAKGKKAKKEPEPEPEELPPSPSQIERDAAEYRAMVRQKNLRKRHWPEVTKVKISTRPWAPPGPPEKMPRVMIELPPLETRRWVPPYRRRRKMRPKLPRHLPEDTGPLSYPQTVPKLIKIWHNFANVDTNKMMLQGSIGCNSKRYSSTACASQTGCIALVARALLEEKSPDLLIRRDVDDVIDQGDRFYKRCMVGMKCYKGKPQLELNQLLPYFFFRDMKYTVKLQEKDAGILAKNPDNVDDKASDLMQLMEKRAGSKYMSILTVGGDKHFLIWGNPPEQGGQVKTICYIFDPFMLDEYGITNKLNGAGAILRYPGVSSFVVDFLNNHGKLDVTDKTARQPTITLTDIEVVQKEPVIRWPDYSLDMRIRKYHCPDEYERVRMQALIDDKMYKKKYALDSLSAVSLAISRRSSKRKVKDFYQKSAPPEPAPTLPIAPEKPPPEPTVDQIMQARGEDFFLFAPRQDQHSFGRDDLIPYPKEEKVQHSFVEFADQNFHTQFGQLDVDKWILRGTRHFASYRYQAFKTYSAIACCVVAMAMCRRLRSRAWNEDTIDETLDVGYNYYRESVMARGGPIRRIVLGELKDTLTIREKEYKQRQRGIAYWGRLLSNDPKIFDLCRAVESFFKEADTGVLQFPGEFEMGIWNEGGKYYVYHPWPADRYGNRVGLQGGGKACLLCFKSLGRMCEHFLDNLRPLKKKPFSISEVTIYDLGDRPEPINKMKPVGPSRWLVRGSYHEADERFPEDHRGKQATPASLAAIAMASIIDPATWTPTDVEEVLNRGDILYEKTMEHLEKMGINFETPAKTEENEAEEEEMSSGTTGTLAAVDVLPRFRITDFDCIETDIDDSAFSGQLNPPPGSGVMSLKDSLEAMFKNNKAAVLTARGGSLAVWKQDDHLYLFDPHGCDENGLPSDEPSAGACLMRMKNDIKELTKVIMGNLSPGADDSFNLSPVDITAAKLNPEIGAPMATLQNKAFEWMNKGTAQILMGPRGENSGIGKAVTKSRVPPDDLAGRTLALPAAAAFCAATATIQPPGMHQDHMYNFIDAGADYYMNHVKKTGRKDIKVEDLGEKFEMGANTFSIEVGESTRLPLRQPDKPAEGGGEEEEGAGGAGEGEEEVGEPPMKEMKELLFKLWYDTTKKNQVYLLLGDYHQLGVWMAAEGQVVAFDAAPTLVKGLLTPQRIKKGDELRLQRIKDEMSTEGEGEADEEEVGGEGEALPEPEPEFVPPESTPVLMICQTPGELIERLVMKAPLDNKQMLGPYWLYPVTVTNELTSVLKEKRPGAKGDGEGEGEEEAEDVLVDPLDDAAVGKYFDRMSRSVASARGRLAQNESYFMEDPNRDNQDAAVAIMAMIVDQIEPYAHWKPSLIDTIVKYGDRLYTLSLAHAANPPRLAPDEIEKEFRVTNFNVKVEVTPDVINGDVKAGESGNVLSLKRGIKKFLDGNSFGVLCAKDYCVGIWKATDGKALCYFDPHPIGPTGKSSPGGGAGLVIFSTLDELADTYKGTLEVLARAGTNKYTIAAVKVNWEYIKTPVVPEPKSGPPDEGYELKVLTGYVETARGRTILRGSRPADLVKFYRDTILQSAASAIVAGCMTFLRRPHLWTRKTVDEIMRIGCDLFASSLGHLGYEFRPGEDVLLPLQVKTRFVLGVNYVRYGLEQIYTGKLEQREPTEMTVRSALERFFEGHTHGILWSSPYAVAVWRVAGAPSYYMMEPHACGTTGLRIDNIDEAAACVLTFSSPKLMAFGYLQNVPAPERLKRDFVLYAMSVSVEGIKRMTSDPPLVKGMMVPATSKVGLDGKKRRAEEKSRQHPPGSTTCFEAQMANEERDKDDTKFRGQRNSNGWLVLNDGSQYMSAGHSISCKRYPYASRGNQAAATCVMAVAMSRVEDVCRWCSTTLDQILDSGDQLYQDSYLHFKPYGTQLLTVEQILRKFYTPGNCVCRVVIYKARQNGNVSEDLYDKIMQFFREERAGVFVAGRGDFAVALFRTPRGFYMFDPADRDRYGRAVAPPCLGKCRSCFSQYPTVKALAEKLQANIPPVMEKENKKTKSVLKITEEAEDGTKITRTKSITKSSTNVSFAGPAKFEIFGMDVSSLRRLNRFEK